MKILVTGAKGFIGKNLIAELQSYNYHDILEFDRETKTELLDTYCKECDFVYHLAGVNRPNNQKEFMEGNFGFTSELLGMLKKHHNACPIVISSSIQAALDNPYGKSKKAGEQLLRAYAQETGAYIFIYRFPNVFGKWCKPNYNSVVATFCYNIAHNLPIQVNDNSTIMRLVYIDDVVEELIQALQGKANKKEDGYCYVDIVHTITLGEIADLIYFFRESRNTKQIPDMTEGSFSKKLYSTYLSYLPQDEFSYSLNMNEDERGSFTEIIRTVDRGQFSVNISKPGIVKGNHWHHSKNEKFVVVSGKALIQLRQKDSNEIIEYYVSGEKMVVVDIPPGYTHTIINVGDTDLVTFMWCNECFDPRRTDTHFLKIKDDEHID